MTVHNILGNGFQPGRRAEVVYQRALAIELEENNIQFQRELEMSLHYKGRGIGSRRVDFFIEKKLMLENEPTPTQGYGVSQRPKVFLSTQGSRN